MTGTIPVPRLCRLERLNDEGEWERVGDYSLLYPHRYPERLAAAGKAGRATVLDDSLRPTKETYTVKVKTCPVCERVHAAPYDGSCLL